MLTRSCRSCGAPFVDRSRTSPTSYCDRCRDPERARVWRRRLLEAFEDGPWIGHGDGVEPVEDEDLVATWWHWRPAREWGPDTFAYWRFERGLDAEIAAEAVELQRELVALEEALVRLEAETGSRELVGEEGERIKVEYAAAIEYVRAWEAGELA